MANLIGFGCVSFMLGFSVQRLTNSDVKKDYGMVSSSVCHSIQKCEFLWCDGLSLPFCSSCLSGSFFSFSSVLLMYTCVSILDNWFPPHGTVPGPMLVYEYC